MRTISLFTGAGGLDLGLEAAGFDAAVCVEMRQEAVSTLRMNRDWMVICRDIHQVSSGEILTTGGLEEAEADLVVGGPPCQPFSKSGFWATGSSGRLLDSRSSTLGEYFRVLEDTLPKVFLLENVPGIAYKSKDEGLVYISKTIDRINRSRSVHYSMSFAVLNLADYGVPQIRQRLFVVGHREGKFFRFPEPTHGEGRLPHLTAWDAIGDLEEWFRTNHALQMRGKWAELLSSIPEGKNYLHHTDRGDGLPIFGWRRRYWNFLLKLAKNLPSWTITASPGPSVGPFHWHNRQLSTRELARIQTFPDGYNIWGSLKENRLQLGNAVPCLIGEILGKEIRAQLLLDPEARCEKLFLLQGYRTPVPDPEPLDDVPRKYLDLVGKHPAHPGSGRGYSAARRAPN